MTVRFKAAIVRKATVADSPRLAEIDDDRYGDTTEDYAADRVEMFSQRIVNSHGWFWVAEVDGSIEGLLAAQPTIHRPASFSSWNDCTANGTFAGSYDASSPLVYVAALTVTRPGSAANATDALLAVGIARAIREGKHQAFFSARMPGYRRFANTMTPAEYYQTRIVAPDRPRDPEIRLYSSLGMKVVRLAEGGFPSDVESGGCAVLMTFDIPLKRFPIKPLAAWLFLNVAKRERLSRVLVKTT